MYSSASFNEELNIRYSLQLFVTSLNQREEALQLVYSHALVSPGRFVVKWKVSDYKC